MVRWLRRGILVAFGLALLEAVLALALAVVGPGDWAWVATLATLALATYTFGVALVRALASPPASRHPAHAVPVRARPTPEARLTRVVARRRERWARLRR